MHDTRIADCITGAMAMMQEQRHEDHEPPPHLPPGRFFPTPGPRPRVQSSALFARFPAFFFAFRISQIWRTR